MLPNGAEFKVMRFDAGFTVVYPVAGLPEEHRPPLEGTETLQTKLHTQNGLTFPQVVDHLCQAFEVRSEDLEPRGEAARPEELGPHGARMEETGKTTAAEAEAEPEDKVAEGESVKPPDSEG